MKNGKRLTPEFLKRLRLRRIAVVHPRDEDGDVLMQQLQRIGCRAQAFWPPPKSLPSDTDVIFCAVQPAAAPTALEWLQSCPGAVIIAVIGYENPTVFDDMLQLGASGVLTSPLRSMGVMAALVMTLALSEEVQALHKRVVRLEQKLSSVNQINEAKLILMRTRGVNHTEAYRMIREQAMSKRIATEEIARAIIHANDILSS
ncbi:MULTISPECIES: ANTAR domain-containing response regulator [Burkholderia cepacia complex]|uniref:ANTAR domain-containing response regulator n=1 Tax=Burkholderia cepacia complex TaxID=87882 RepID=UPI000CFFBB6E|nr:MULTISPECIES: ANTAR domain-containing protein [Burkholderia cepacia complex]MBR8304749.1 ANTAR domain-containing protein [Burkholderia dolosa]PRH30640.1 ANTAR domain-containing protein [Burkholderia multivorans]